MALIAEISGESPSRDGDELLLTEDLHLDSLGRVQLAAAIEERTGIAAENGLWDRVQTVGDLRRLVRLDVHAAHADPLQADSAMAAADESAGGGARPSCFCHCAGGEPGVCSLAVVAGGGLAACDVP